MAHATANAKFAEQPKEKAPEAFLILRTYLRGFKSVSTRQVINYLAA